MRLQHLAGIAWLSLMAAPAFATTAQQQKMVSCNQQAGQKQLKGDDRKGFMKTCLSASGTAAPAANSQQEKMKSCNADAKTKALKGDDRKAFMKTCLSGS